MMNIVVFSTLNNLWLWPTRHTWRFCRRSMEKAATDDHPISGAAQGTKGVMLAAVYSAGWSDVSRKLNTSSRRPGWSSGHSGRDVLLCQSTGLLRKSERQRLRLAQDGCMCGADAWCITYRANA